MVGRKEIHYFSDNKRYEHGMGWYEAFFEDLAGCTAIGEATPEYLYRPEAPRRIDQDLGPIRCIAVLRNPVDRAYSAYQHGRSVGVQKAPTFEDALDQEDRALAMGRWGFLSLVDRGRYLRQLQRYERRFGRDSLHVVLFDDLTADPGQVLDGTFRFLGVDSTFRLEQYHAFNPARASRIPPGLRRRIARMERSPLRSRLMALTAEKTKSPPMQPSTRAALVERFRAENAALGEWLGRDLTSWNN
jgi:hypothetical protein